MIPIATSGSDAPRPVAPAGGPPSHSTLRLRVFQPDGPAAALGLAVSYLMNKPAFARLGFGSWSRVLTGQINRGDFRFVADDAGGICGFLGWVLTNEAAADMWLAGREGAGGANGAGDCIVFNAWAAETPAVNRFVLAVARQAAAGCRLIYFKRFYADGRIRPGRMPVNAFFARSRGGS